MKSPASALMLHPPRLLRQQAEIMAMPMGLLSIADLLAASGVPTEVVHLGLERDTSPGFDPAADVLATGAGIVFITLHWHAQVRPALLLAETLRRRAPGVVIAVGGYTASYFARELLEHFAAVDYVIRGDGELPAVRLCAAVAGGPDDLGTVPNLAWRERGEVRLNPLSWQVDEHNAAGLRHAAFEHLRHSAAYLERHLYSDFSEGRASPTPSHTFFYNPGRGCPVRCTCCGGGAGAQQTISGRCGFFFYPDDKVRRDLAEAWAAGARTWRVSFDPTASRTAYTAILSAEQAAGRCWHLVFDCWSLPTAELLQGLTRTCEPGSMLVISPECGDEDLRRRHRGYHFTNAALLEAVRGAGAAGFETHAFFTVGLPGETTGMIERTTSLAKDLVDAGAGVSVCPMVLDPGSPLFESPHEFGVTLRVRNLRDYFNLSPNDPGPFYRTEHLSELDIRAAAKRLAWLSAHTADARRHGADS
ncbi:MAG: cobalamin B12-binding domain-containing protein [Deltaproteobacteria bacterium]|nr:cobalamin B12-binding domain-containing protein [Deltaproteobacteria bacterium]